jgi:glutamate/aspartate transport system substrate-binding protein
LTAAIVDDLRQALKRPALAVRSVPVTGANRIPLLLDGSIDLECGSTTNTAARGKDVSFAISHFYTGTRLLVRSDSGIRNYADLTGKTVASVAGSTNEKVLRQTSDERRLGVQVVLGKDYAEGLALLERGDAVALALDDVLLFGLRANSANPAALDVVGDTLQVEPYGCMLRKGDPEFKALVDGTISRLMASGEFARLYAKWFMAGIPPRGAVLNMPMSEALRNNLRQRSDQPAM